MAKLYSYGCSFSDVSFKNDEIKLRGYNEHKLYTELLSKKLNLELEYNASPGRGNNSILLDFALSNFEDNSIIIIQLTLFTRIELLVKHTNPNVLRYSEPAVGPFTSATLTHFKDDLNINDKFINTYINFVDVFYDIICFTDLYNTFKIIEDKKKKYKNCKFLVISAGLINEENFKNDKHLIDMISINGFMNKNYPTHGNKDPHLNKWGNLNLFRDLYTIIMN